ncbi:MAG: glycosyltransferase family 39 protein, partial [Tepidisphaeraceae bacterium]
MIGRARPYSWVAALAPFEPAPADFPNRLADPQPQRCEFGPRGWTLAGLVLLCLAVRVPMALRITTVVSDGVVYVEQARSLENGILRAGVSDRNVNPFPVILSLLHRAGLDWQVAGAAWGVAISSLVVLPLYGWVRRQFDDRVARTACFLYAVQPKMITWSPELMRDPTFWFLFTLSIFLLWRAITEVRLRLFFVAGIIVSLTCLTRIEGIYLLILLGLWSFWRWLALEVQRRRLIFGVLLCLGATPALLLAAKLALFRNQANWGFARLDPVLRFYTWIHAMLGSGLGSAACPAPSVSLSIGRMLWIFLPTVTRGLSPFFALLMFGGLWGWRRMWVRRDHQPLFYASLAVLAGAWVQLWYDHAMCPRYVLPIVLMGAMFAALGLLGLMERVAVWSRQRAQPARIRVLLMVLPLIVVAVHGVGEAMIANRSYFAARQAVAELGTRLGRDAGPIHMVVGPEGVVRIAQHYAGADACRWFRMENGDESIITALVRQARPDVLLLRPTKSMNAQ